MGARSCSACRCSSDRGASEIATDPLLLRPGNPIPPPDGAGLLEQLLDLRAAFPDCSIAPILKGGQQPTIVCKEVKKGSTLQDSLKAEKAVLVSGFMKRAADGWDYYSCVEIARAKVGQRFDSTLLETSRAVRMSWLPDGSDLWEVSPWNSTGDFILCWNIEWTNARQTQGQRLLQFALSLVVFNASTTVAKLQASFNAGIQRLEDTLAESSAQSLLRELTEGSDDADGIFTQTAKLTKSETGLIQEQRDSMPVHELNFEEFLRDPAVSSMVGFRMRLVVVGHPSVPTFEVMQLLKNMEQSQLAVARRVPPIKHRTVLSDIDDTLHPAHDANTIAISGQDTTPVVHGEIYPSIERVHRALVQCPEDNRVCYPVFLSARPATFAQKHKPELQCLAKKIAINGRPQQSGGDKKSFCFILPGANDVGSLLESVVSILRQNLPGMQKGMITSLGKKKAKRVLQYLRLFPEPTYVFIGDDGQGDFEAARILLSLTREQVSAPMLAKLQAEIKEGDPKMFSDGLLQAVTDVVDGVRSMTSDTDGYVGLLRQELRSPHLLPIFSDENPPLFDFVAIKAVKTQSGYLFSERTREQRETCMRQIYGTNRFFYFNDYDELWNKLNAAKWIGNS